MSSNIYLTSSEGHSGKSAVALGFIEAFSRRVGRVGVFRPLIQGGDERDAVLQLLLDREDPGTGLGYDDSYGITYEQLHADPDEAIPTIVERFKRVEQASDAVVIVGSDFTDVGNPAELGDNARIAANLGARVVLVVTGRDPHDLTARTPEQVARAVDSTVGELREAHTVLGGVVVNRGDEAQLDQIRSAVEATLVADSDVPVPVWVLPEEPLLAAPSVAQLLTALGGRLVAGDEALLGREVLGVTIAGMAMENVLDRLIEGGLLIVAADRTETLLAVLLAQEADTFPFLSGVIVNGPFEFSPVIERLIAGIGPSLPIVRTDGGTFETAQRILQTRGSLATGSRRKRDVALASFEGRVPAEAVFELVDAPAPTVVTPAMFEYGLLDRARADRKRIVLPEGDDDRILLAAGTLLDRRVADLTILGDESEVRARAAGLGVELGAAQVLSPHDPELVGRFAEEYARLRAHKGVSVEQAAERVQDVSYFGTMMVHLGLADGMVSGAAHTTAHTIRPSFEIVKTKPGTSIVSSVFLMSLADRVLVYGDCAVNPDPNAEQLADIAISSAATAAQFGVAPRIAMLSYSTGDSGSGADVDKVREATDLVRTRRPDLLVEGPIQYDAATDLAVASKKLPGSDVAGRATVFIFPDLNTGNNTYKAVQRSAGAVAIGPVLQGLNKPINDLSRGALVADIVNTVAITAIQAQGAPE